MKFKLEKKEILYAFVGVLFIIIWFLWVKNLIAPSLIKLPPFLAMIIYSFGFLIGFGFISSILTSTKLKIKASIIGFLFVLGVDLIYAPYIVNKVGVINQTVDYWFVTTDAAIASLWDLILPNNFIWFFTYIITPVLFMFIIPILIANPKIISKLWKK